MEKNKTLEEGNKRKLMTKREVYQLYLREKMYYFLYAVYNEGIRFFYVESNSTKITMLNSDVILLFAR